MDEVRIWDDIRTDSEISDNRLKCLVGNEANLQAYWRFDNNPNDETSNGNDLTENNSPTYQTGNLPFDDASCGAPVAPTPIKGGLILF